VHCAGNRPVKVSTGRVVQNTRWLANSLVHHREHSTVYTPAGAMDIDADAVIVSVVPLLRKRLGKFAVYDLVAELARFSRVVQ
jgi:hypothetical protein